MFMSRFPNVFCPIIDLMSRGSRVGSFALLLLVTSTEPYVVKRGKPALSACIHATSRRAFCSGVHMREIDDNK